MALKATVAQAAIEVPGLDKFRRVLKATDRGSTREVQTALRTASKLVAAEAASTAPRGATGQLAESYRGTSVGTRGIVRNRQFYSRFIEFGFHPGGSSTFVPGVYPIERAVERRADRIVDLLSDGLDHAARSAGWS